MMADLFEPPRAAAAAGLAPARARSRSASVRQAPKAPICRKLRRLMPSQKRCRAPQKVSMVVSPLYEPPNTSTPHCDGIRGGGRVATGFFQLAAPAVLLPSPLYSGER